VKFLRQQGLVVLLFSIISMGQAYPLAYLFASVQEMKCGCNQVGRACIHGCELKKHRRHANHLSHSNKPSEMKRHGCHAKKTKMAWVNPDCSQQSEQEILSFHSEPFLVKYEGTSLKTLNFVNSFPSQEHFSPFWISSLDPPPPRC
jgi:hypothetical protein